MFVLPSRKRPHNIKRFFYACQELGSETRGVVCLDEDDNSAITYPVAPEGWRYELRPRASLSFIYNDVFDKYPHLPWYGVWADDVLPETPRWDRALIDAAGADGLAFGDDGINGGNHPTHFVLGGNLVREIGFLALPGLDRIFIDRVWADIARLRGVYRYLPDVQTPHLMSPTTHRRPCQ